LDRYFHKRFCLIVLCCFAFGKTKAQTLSFHHINTADGLSENNVRSVAIDKKGFLWVGTVDGLNLFDGYTVTVFKKEDHPQMASDNVIHLTCDSRDRLWLGTPEGITWLDEKRNFHRVTLQDSISKFASRTIMDTRTYGPVLYTSLGQFFFNERSGKWKKLDWISDKLQYRRFSDSEPFDENKIIYATDSLVIILDYATHRIVYEQPFTQVTSLCRYSDHEIAVGLQYGPVQIADINTKKIVREYQLKNEMNKPEVSAAVTEVRPAVNGDLLVATGYDGLAIIDREGNIAKYTHDPVNPRSIGSNLIWRVLGGINGDVIVGTSTAGISTFNIYDRQAGFKNLFTDGEGNYFDSYVNEIAEDRNNVLWICAQDRLIRWDKEKNKCNFYYYHFQTPLYGLQRGEFRTLCFDKTGRLWVSIVNDGLAVFNEATGQFRKINLDTSLGPALKGKYIHCLMTGNDGTIWASTNLGIYSVNPSNLAINSFLAHPLLKTFSGKRVISLFQDRQNNTWIGTSGNGVYYFDERKNELVNYTTKNGLLSNACYGIKDDRRGNIYVATTMGFNIITPEKKILSFTRSDGLKYSRCSSFLEDEYGSIWIANYKCLIKFSPVTRTMKYFDENSGINEDGFRTGCSYKRKNGELLWGGMRGINYFLSRNIANNTKPLRVIVYGATVPDSTIRFISNQGLSVPYSDNNIAFHFTAIKLSNPGNIFYQYMLQGFENDWQRGKDTRLARYSSLPPGKYTFKLRASVDGINWIPSSNEIAITVIPPLWQKWWFISVSSIIIITTLYFSIRYRNKKMRKQREELETEQAINYFASSIYDDQTVDTILWDVARNCIGRLKFEDCVIYLLDAKRHVLVQKAAHGPKSPRQFEISQPIEIPIGKGIVGSVALSGKAEIISNTANDPRYIVDDERRHSEISVPIMSDGKVLGVIDCEHSKKSFFTQKHLSILTTIASLCANKIVRTKAEEEKERAQLTLMDTQRKMTEVEMQALRAQMNPHFIFNCLNSINRYIVKSDQVTASFYLTKFAKLIRLILDNSNSKNVILTNELEALKLYIEMEALRFDKKFDYKICVDKAVNTDSVEVPPLIIQPYVENAIWHGLLHKETPGCLCISVSLPDENVLQCVIEDDGIGREKAKELKSKSATTRKSLGMKLTEHRLNLLNKYAELNASIDIIDLKNETGESQGTRVILMIPI